MSLWQKTGKMCVSRLINLLKLIHKLFHQHIRKTKLILIKTHVACNKIPSNQEKLINHIEYLHGWCLFCFLFEETSLNEHLNSYAHWKRITLYWGISSLSPKPFVSIYVSSFSTIFFIIVKLDSSVGRQMIIPTAQKKCFGLIFWYMPSKLSLALRHFKRSH